MLKILCLGPIWRGSDANTLFNAMSRIGNIVQIIDENYYINLSNKSLWGKAVAKISRPLQIKEFNDAIIKSANLMNPDLVLVYKGAFILPETILTLKSKYLFINVYPDVSFRTHGGLLPKTLPLYHHIFTTKTFGINDLKEQFGYKNTSFIPHCFDPHLHRPLALPENLNDLLHCDVSFIGGWSQKKEELVSNIEKGNSNIKIRIWGGRWENHTNKNLKPFIMNQGIHGDMYALGVGASKINLGIVHEKVAGASQGDLITSRTFHIPACGGFMIHEYNEESILYFKEDEEAVFYKNSNELVEKVKYYLENNDLREKIRVAGYNRVLKDHSADKRAQQILNQLKLI